MRMRIPLRRAGGWAADALALAAIPLWLWLQPRSPLAPGAAADVEEARLRTWDRWRGGIADYWKAGLDGVEDPSMYQHVSLLASGAVGPLGAGRVVWPPVRAAWPALERCGVGPEDQLNFSVQARFDQHPWEVALAEAPAGTEGCVREALSRLPLQDLVPADGVLFAKVWVRGEDISRPPPLEMPPPPLSLGEIGSMFRRSDEEAPPAAYFVLDEAGVRALHALVACPAPAPLTRLDLRWRAEALADREPAGLAARTDPPAPCAEERAKAHWPEIVALFRSNGWRISWPDPDAEEPAVAPADGWSPESWERALSYQIDLVMPPEAAP